MQDIYVVILRAFYLITRGTHDNYLKPKILNIIKALVFMRITLESLLKASSSGPHLSTTE